MPDPDRPEQNDAQNTDAGPDRGPGEGSEASAQGAASSPEPEKPKEDTDGDAGHDAKKARTGPPVEEHFVASTSAVDKLKAKVAEREAKTKKPKPHRKRMSDEKRQALWHQAVIKKARKLKLMTDLVLILLLALVVGMHFAPFIPFVGRIEIELGEMREEYGPKTGFELFKDLVLEHRRPRFETVRDERGLPRLDRATGGTIRRFFRVGKDPDKPGSKGADLAAWFILAIPLGAALLLLLYLLDYLVWMGRPLPGLSALWGYGCVGYLMYARVPKDSTWEALGYNAGLAWYMLLVPLFLIGTVSMLRFVVSQRWKRYEFAGLPLPTSSPEAAEIVRDIGEGGPAGESAPSSAKAAKGSPPELQRRGASADEASAALSDDACLRAGGSTHRQARDSAES